MEKIGAGDLSLVRVMPFQKKFEKWQNVESGKL
jgi:hypothetical protein